uniref:Uncharacterized protein n=1 Tax=uncultured bacterium A1Q1_fos_75 TaxID=1256589 RepID=L7VQL2_9BACT|nr:hypothetical protein [uncultured bacterium A1Q1_fos_75]
MCGAFLGKRVLLDRVKSIGWGSDIDLDRDAVYESVSDA